jgi:hypothetical protein
MATRTKDKKEKRQGAAISYPAEYQIHIQGKLDTNWSDRLAGMSIATAVGKNAAPLTTLQGELVDQSALLGVLNTLHDLRYDILHVKHISPTATNDTGNN